MTMRRRDFIAALSIAPVWHMSSAALARSVITQSDGTLAENAPYSVRVDGFSADNGHLDFCLCAVGSFGTVYCDQFRSLPALGIANSQEFLAYPGGHQRLHDNLLPSATLTPGDRRSEIGARLQELLSDKHLAFVVGDPDAPLERGMMEHVGQIAKAAGVLTLAVVPSAFQSRARNLPLFAASGADSVIEIPPKSSARSGYQGVLPSLAEESARIAHDIARMVVEPGIVGVDLEDLKTVLGGCTHATASTGTGSGPNRARAAIEAALLASRTFPAEAAEPQGVAVAITGPKDLRIREVSDIMKTLSNQCGTSTHVIFGANLRDDAGDVLRVTVLMARQT